MSINPLFYFLGDSLTEYGNLHLEGGWLLPIIQNYARKVDVVNRGYSGYNTKIIQPIVDQIVESEWKFNGDKVEIVTVMFGSNDSALSFHPQHVPLLEYVQNLKTIINKAKVNCKNAKIVLITPPPMNDDMWWAEIRSEGETAQNRNLGEIQKYREAVLDFEVDPQVTVLDIWLALNQESRWFTDGLHLSKQGNQALSQAWLKCIEDKFPILYHENRKFSQPYWRTVLKMQ